MKHTSTYAVCADERCHVCNGLVFIYLRVIADKVHPGCPGCIGNCIKCGVPYAVTTSGGVKPCSEQMLHYMHYACAAAIADIARIKIRNALKTEEDE